MHTVVAHSLACLTALFFLIVLSFHLTCKLFCVCQCIVIRSFFQYLSLVIHYAHYAFLLTDVYSNISHLFSPPYRLFLMDRKLQSSISAQSTGTQQLELHHSKLSARSACFPIELMRRLPIFEILIQHAGLHAISQV